MVKIEEEKGTSSSLMVVFLGHGRGNTTGSIQSMIKS
jgi:hypothetical protein